MSEEMARALGAGNGTFFKIGGKECPVRPLSIKELAEVERECVNRYKRDYLETFSKNLDLLPPDQRLTLMDRKMEQVAKWDVDDLPAKKTYDSSRINLTDELKARLESLLGLGEISDERRRRLVAVAMDQGMLTEDEYRNLSGQEPPSYRVDYVNWWSSSCFDGMVSLAHACFRHNGVTRDDVTEATRGNLVLLSEMVAAVSGLSRANVGNG